LKPWFSKGSSITEYTLPIALIAVAGIISLTAFGDSLQGIFASYGNKPNLAPTNKQAASAPSANESQTPSLSGAPETASETSPDIIDDKLAPPSFLSNISSAIDSTGANGTTEELASYLSQYVAQKLKEGKITESQANILQDLANEGHSLAAYQKALETAFVNKSQTISYNGQSYSIEAFGKLIGGQNADKKTVSSVESNTSSVVGEKLQTFLSKYQQAVNSNAMIDPQIYADVSSLSSNIVTISASLGNRASDIFNTSQHATLYKPDGTLVFDSDLKTTEQRQDFLNTVVSGDFSVLVPESRVSASRATALSCPHH
jgi:Flp pilus assembly pilin Flp